MVSSDPGGRQEAEIVDPSRLRPQPDGFYHPGERCSGRYGRSTDPRANSEDATLANRPLVLPEGHGWLRRVTADG